MNTDAVILCGGLGTRLQSVTGDKPKALVDLHGRPFMDILLEYLKIHGIRRVILCVCHQAQVIKDHYKEHSLGLEIAFSREIEPLGTGGALKLSRPLIQSENFFVFNGDSFCNVNLSEVLDFHQRHHALATQVLVKSYGSGDVGTVVIDDEKRILQFHEKTQETLPEGTAAYMNTGFCCFSREIFGFMPPEKKFSLEYDLYPKIINEPFYGYPVDVAFWDVGTPHRLQQARQLLKESQNHENGF